MSATDSSRIHPLPCVGEPPPSRFTCPFCYTAHPLCVAAVGRLRQEILLHPEWQADLRQGKMLGVLVVDGAYLAAFSGTLCGRGDVGFFVPPVFDLHDPDCHFQQEEREISLINKEIGRLDAQLHPQLQLLRDRLAALRLQADQEIEEARERKRSGERAPDVGRSQYLNAEIHRAKVRWRERLAAVEGEIARLEAGAQALRDERMRRSARLQEWLFSRFTFLNARGESLSLGEIFSPAVPPAGAGECCAPKLLQYAYAHGLRPLCMAEFWMGESPKDEARVEGNFYPSCQAKCGPILAWMLQGLAVDDNPLLREYSLLAERMRIIYEDADIAVVVKPAGMLSVPGKLSLPSVRSEIERLLPRCSGPLIVHRLDMATSGLMVLALGWEAYHRLQEQFVRHTVVKRYVARLQRPLLAGAEGEISLPLCANPADRPRQMVSGRHGRRAVTRYRASATDPSTVYFWPLTGRTHQLRLHAAHPQGLGNPIVGDALYGKPSSRLFLHADYLQFIHPSTGEKVSFTSEPEGWHFR
ncbi:MAG: pseudouridine synthase [Prevotellaceae bacterium]|nr:pseudouridine synthase [Prevotellaceae bacterium]